MQDSGFEKEVKPTSVIININENYPLLKLASKLSWEEMLDWILPNLKQSTAKGFWWKGKPLYVRSVVCEQIKKLVEGNQ